MQFVDKKENTASSCRVCNEGKPAMTLSYFAFQSLETLVLCKEVLMTFVIK